MQILSLLKQLAKELQLTILFIAHDVQIVQAFADRVIRITDKPKHDKVPD
jgi:ABC-type oligopeptide transport system ATPase subunit